MSNRTSRGSAEHYSWGESSDGWRLVDRSDLSVIEERVPAGGSEEWHVHSTARQFFYVLDGVAVMRTADGDISLSSHTGIEIEPGLAHQFTLDRAKSVSSSSARPAPAVTALRFSLHPEHLTPPRSADVQLHIARRCGTAATLQR